VRARQGLKELSRAGRLDALFIHTQVPAVLAPDWLGRVPTIVSLDATPPQYDELGELYDHRPGHPFREHLTWRANRACFRRARGIVTWSSWTRAGLVSGYGVDPAKVSVIPPGVRMSDWAPHEDDADGAGPVRILFVGGDFVRKGGDVLLEAFDELGRDGTDAIELDIVTGSDVAPRPGVVVHSGLGPISPELRELYRRADVFCLPTRADCLPMVLSEAGAAGLPAVSTAVAGIPEIIDDGKTGLVVPVDDAAALANALRALVRDRDLRLRLGAAARARVERDFNAEVNFDRLVELLLRMAEPNPSST
jgi:glycosyltransferase involved in cell wall biosynthesis